MIELPIEMVFDGTSLEVIAEVAVSANTRYLTTSPPALMLTYYESNSLFVRTEFSPICELKCFKTAPLPSLTVTP